MARVITPPLFSVRGKLNIGQALTLVLTDAVVRYYKQKGEEVLFHSKSYNSQGIPIEKQMKKGSNTKINERDYVKKANSLIKKIEDEKNFLNLVNDGGVYIDYYPSMRELSKKMFNVLFSKGYVFPKKEGWYFDSPKVLNDPLFRESLKSLNFQPKNFFGNLEQMVKDISNPLRISKEREFATKIPKRGGLSLDPLWDLTTQQSTLEESHPTILICGRNMSTRYVLYSFLTNFAMEGKIPFDKILIHNILKDSEGKRMSNSNKNVLYIENIINDNPSDALRYSLFRATTFEKETSNFFQYFIKEGISAVHRMGNLRKFFVKKRVSLDNLPVDNPSIKKYTEKMDSMNLKGAFIFSQEYLQKLSKQIKYEHDNNSLGNIKGKAIKYKTGIIMSYPFIPQSCCRSIRNFNDFKYPK